MSAAPRRWIRLDVGWSDSDWVSSLEPGGRLAWVELLTYTKRDGTAGVVKALTPAAFARKVRVSAEDATAMLEAAKKDGALTEADGSWTVVNWPDFQEPDRTAAERQRRHRADKSRLSPLRRDNRDTPLQPVTGGVTRHATETETEITEEKKTPPLEAQKKSRASRWRLVPDSWEPNDAHRALASQLGLDLTLEVAKFRDHEFRDPKSDADKTFRNWLRNARPVANGSNGSRPFGKAQQPGSTLEKIQHKPGTTEKPKWKD